MSNKIELEEETVLEGVVESEEQLAELAEIFFVERCLEMFTRGNESSQDIRMTMMGFFGLAIIADPESTKVAIGNFLIDKPVPPEIVTIISAKITNLVIQTKAKGRKMRVS